MEEIFQRLRHWCPPAGHGTAVRSVLPFYRAPWPHPLPPGLDAIVATADLQGRTTRDDSPDSLLGVAAAHELSRLAQQGQVPPLQRCLVLLAGDFSCAPRCAKRGGLGDVRPVWQAFADTGAKVVGIAGNHDIFGEKGPPSAGTFLDGDVAEPWPGLRVGGVSGIVGDPKRRWRRTASDFHAQLDRLVEGQPDIIVVHPPPDLGPGAEGESVVTQWLEEGRFTGVLVCGHHPWAVPRRHHGHADILNVHGSVAVFTASSSQQES